MKNEMKSKKERNMKFKRERERKRKSKKCERKITRVIRGMSTTNIKKK